MAALSFVYDLFDRLNQRALSTGGACHWAACVSGTAGLHAAGYSHPLALCEPSALPAERTSQALTALTIDTSAAAARRVGRRAGGQPCGFGTSAAGSAMVHVRRRH